MSKYPVGARVIAIRNADAETVYLYGYGVYDGDFAPSPLAEDWPNPRITLDDGAVVWGCECWWGPEDRAEKFLGGRRIERVPPPERVTDEGIDHD